MYKVQISFLICIFTMTEESECIPDNSVLVTITDPETSNQYQLYLSSEDRIKIKQDQQFFYSILNHCKIHYTNTVVNKKIWSYDNTIALINTVHNYQEDMSHPKKRKYVWEHISNELISNRVHVNKDECSRKWKNLLRTYKSCKDHEHKSGRAPSKFQFMREMDEFLGSKPNIGSSHAVNISTLRSSKSSKSSNIEQMPSTSSFTAALPIPSTSADADMVQDERESVSIPAVTPQNSEAIIDPAEDVSTEPPHRAHTQTQRPPKRSKSAVTEYLQEKTQYMKDKRAELLFNRQYKQRRLELEERKVKALEALAVQYAQLE